MKTTRRHLLLQGGACLPPRHALARLGATPIKLGSLLDTSGNFDAYGKPMNMALDLALDDQQSRRPAGPAGEQGGLRHERRTWRCTRATRSSSCGRTRWMWPSAASSRPARGHPAAAQPRRHSLRVHAAVRGRRLRRQRLHDWHDPGAAGRGAGALRRRRGGKVYILAADYNYGQLRRSGSGSSLRDNGAAPPWTFSRSTSPTSTRPSPRSSRRDRTSCSALAGGAHPSSAGNSCRRHEGAHAGRATNTQLTAAEGGMLVAYNSLARTRHAGQPGLSSAGPPCCKQHRGDQRARGAALPGRQAVGRGRQARQQHGARQGHRGHGRRHSIDGPGVGSRSIAPRTTSRWTST